MVGRAERHADAAGGLVAGNNAAMTSCPTAWPGAIGSAGSRRGMARHRQVDVVVIERVADGAVDQRGR
jgi:hypothetical protein